MSYGVAAALQMAVYQRLMTDPTLAGLVGSDIYDALPSGNVPTLYVALGPELAKDMSDVTGGGAEHEFTISVVTAAAGFATAKEAGAAISDALVDQDLALSRGRLVSLHFYRAKAVRDGDADERRIDLTFKARVQDD